MCAIGGIYLKSGEQLDIPKYLKAMMNLQNHRGPDGQGMWLSANKNVGLCHNRLSILDLTTAGNQPMNSNDGRYTIVFNGEIFNYIELQKQLIAKGSKFQTSSDTEILLEAYQCIQERILMNMESFDSVI